MRVNVGDGRAREVTLAVADAQAVVAHTEGLRRCGERHPEVASDLIAEF
jgi:hypothetical protein